MPFCTHISPVTGEIFDLQRWSTETLIVDGAQSIGTCFQGQLLRSAAIFLAPLHKHLNLGVGLGIVGVDFRRIAEHFHEDLETVLHVMKRGALNLPALETSVAQLERKGPAINTARINVGRNLEVAAHRLGLSVVTPTGVQGHMVCFTGLGGRPIEEIFDSGRIAARILKKENILRISFHSDFHGALSPDEYEQLAISCLESGCLDLAQYESSARVQPNREGD